MTADPDLQKDPAILRVINKATAKYLLEWYLKYKQANQIDEDDED